MNDDIKALTELKKKIETAKAKGERSAGVLEKIMSTLKKDWGCSTIEEADTKLRSLNKRIERLKEEFKEKSSKFEEIWGAKLREI